MCLDETKYEDMKLKLKKSVDKKCAEVCAYFLI